MESYILKNELFVFGYIRKQYAVSSTSSMSMPTEIIRLCLSFYLETFKILRFSAKYKSKNVLLKDNNKCIKAKKNQHCYAICDVGAVKKGKHCWRFHTKNPSKGWILYGLSQKKKHMDDSYELVYGMANCDQWFPLLNGIDYKEHNDASSWYFCKQKECQIDMFLDLDKFEIKWCIVGDTDSNHEEPKLFKLPRRKRGWVPHINIHDKETQLRVASIPTELYGINIDNEYIFK